MLNKRILAFCIMLAVLVTVLQAVPRIFEGSFVFAVILGGILVYIAARLNCIFGVAVHLAAIVLSASMNIGEAVFFACTNGIVGLSLGIIKRRFKSIYYARAFSALIVVVMLFAINYLLGIDIFGNTSLKPPMSQALKLFSPLYIYCLIYLKLAIFSENLLHRNINLSSY